MSSPCKKQVAFAEKKGGEVCAYGWSKMDLSSIIELTGKIMQDSRLRSPPDKSRTVLARRYRYHPRYLPVDSW